MHNFRLSLRTLFRTPFITVVAVLSLGLGIGANAAIYSLFNEMLLAPLPVPHPEQLVNFGGNNVSPGPHQCGTIGGCDMVFSYPMFRDLERQAGPFSGIAGHVLFSANVAFRGNSVTSDAELVSGSYFPVLGVRPAVGRLFGVSDDETIGGHPLAVLSHEFWQSRLGGDPSAVGQAITINGRELTILGVAAADFHGTTLGARPGVFVPLTMRREMSSGDNGLDDRRNYWLYMFGRLRPGVSPEQAQASENVLYHRILNTIEVPLQAGLSERMLARFKSKNVMLEDGRRGSSTLAKQTRVPLTLLLAITAIVLAIACANIANLLLARAANRATEIAVRLSLGATGRHLVVQLLTESALLAALGGVAGLGVAFATLKGMVTLLPVAISSSLSFSLSGRAIAVAGLLSMLNALVFGLIPALHSVRPDLATALRNGSGKASATRGLSLFRSSLVTAQMALSMALLVTAALFLESIANVGRLDLGIVAENLVTFRVAPVLNAYSGQESAQLFSRLEAELGALPGVRGVAGARVEAVNGKAFKRDIVVQGFTKAPDADATSYYDAVGPNYFKTLGASVLAGREFTTSDVAGAPRVAIVNEAFAKTFRLGSNPVGKMIGEGDHPDLQIVGLVKDSKYSGVKQALGPVYFVPYKQDTSVGILSFYVRSTVPTPVLAPQIRSVLTKLDRTVPLQSFKTMPQEIRDNVYLDRMISVLSAAFAVLATLLAAIGLYGVLAYAVTQRTKEIGVRMALGANSGRIMRMVLTQVALMTFVGAVAGAVAGYGVGRGAAALLFDVRGTDPVAMAASAAVLGLVALLAGSIPALRASRIDPVLALRHE